jgi:hypothetical protein
MGKTIGKQGGAGWLNSNGRLNPVCLWQRIQHRVSTHRETNDPHPPRIHIRSCLQIGQRPQQIIGFLLPKCYRRAGRALSMISQIEHQNMQPFLV